MEKKRLLSLDVLRGATVCLMILVNNGAGKHIYATLQHSKWNGMTPCFPFLSLHYGDFNLSQSEENQLHMEQTSGFQDS